jgi:adenylate cyclase
MTDAAQAGVDRRLGPAISWQRELRLASGLVLIAFAASHFLNHAAGVLGLEMMEAAQNWRYGFWRSRIGSAMLAIAFVVHFGLGILRIALRRTWRMSWGEAAQIALALAIPFLLVNHFVGTRVMATATGLDMTYTAVLRRIWPGHFWDQTALMLVVWLHGCLGIHFAFRVKRWFKVVEPALFAVALLVPALAIAGYISAGREALALVRPPETYADTDFVIFDNAQRAITHGYYAVLGGLALIVLARVLWRKAGRRVAIRYVGHGERLVKPGSTLLEMSRAAGVPHSAICGGRGRCGTCRVLVTGGSGTLPEPRAAERALLARIGAPRNVRLACQIRPATDLNVQLLLPVDDLARLTAEGGQRGLGAEKRVTVLVADMRGFTALTQRNQPVEVAAFLNRFLDELIQAVKAHGGRVDIAMVDGVMAVFGLKSERADAGAKSALAAANDMLRTVGVLNDEFKGALPQPVRIGIGIHTGPTVVADVDHPSLGRKSLALGETVAVASRLEQATKELLSDVVASEDTLKAAGRTAAGGVRRELAVSGRIQPVVAYGVETRDVPKPVEA